MGIRRKQAESLPWTALIKGSGVKVQGCRGTAVSINLLSLYRNIYHLSPIFVCVSVFDQYSGSPPLYLQPVQDAKLAFLYYRTNGVFEIEHLCN